MTLTQQQEFDALVEHAKLAGQARDWQGARQAWVKALSASSGFRRISAHQELASKTSICSFPKRTPGKSGWRSWAPSARSYWYLSKFKLLLLGLTKLSTFASMLAFFAVYWSLFGWRFALGFVMSASTSTRWAT